MSIPQINPELQAEMATLGLVLNQAGEIFKATGEDGLARVQFATAEIIGLIIAGCTCEEAMNAYEKGDLSKIKDATIAVQMKQLESELGL